MTLLSIGVGRIFSIIGTVLGGIVLGALIALWMIVRSIRRKIQIIPDTETLVFEDESEEATISRYVRNCEDELAKTVRARQKVNRRSFIRKKIAEERAKRKSAKTPIEPPEERPTVSFDKTAWYPVYLMLHNIGAYYRSDEPLSFLDITEKEIFEILRKVAGAVEKVLEGVDVDALKKIKCYALLETLDMVMSVFEPLSKHGVIKAFKYSKEGYTGVMKLKNVFSINPFYYIRRAINRKITLELTVECVKYAVDVIANEIVDVYKRRLKVVEN